MSYKELPQRMAALEQQMQKLHDLVHWLAQRMPPRGGEGAFVFICPHCGKDAFSTPNEPARACLGHADYENHELVYRSPCPDCQQPKPEGGRG